MKKKLYVIFLMLFFIACRENETMLYDSSSKDCVFFQRDGSFTLNNQGVVVSRSYVDSSVFSMANSKLEKKEFIKSIPIKLVGNIVNYDRKLSFRLNDELTTAKIGEDFEMNLDTVYLRAGKSSANLNVKLLRNNRLQLRSYRIAFDILANENFNIAMNSYKNDDRALPNSKNLSGVTFKLIFSDMASKPGCWNFFAASKFGNWTIRKFNVLNELMGWTSLGWSWTNWGKVGDYPSYGKMHYAALKLQALLQESADSGNPILEDDGKKMQLKAPYEVNY